MAVTKIWPVRGKPDSPLKYISNELKTENPRWDKTSLGNLTDVMHYAVDADKTEKQFFVTGINCSVEIARDQFVTVKKQFAKEDLRFHQPPSPSLSGQGFQSVHNPLQ